jgi:hypothetical protein
MLAKCVRRLRDEQVEVQQQLEVTSVARAGVEPAPAACLKLIEQFDVPCA